MITINSDKDLYRALNQAKSFVACAEEYFQLQSSEDVPSKEWLVFGKKRRCVKLANVLVQRLYKFKNVWSL